LIDKIVQQFILHITDFSKRKRRRYRSPSYSGDSESDKSSSSFEEHPVEKLNYKRLESFSSKQPTEKRLEDDEGKFSIY
jgi:hypothetical protein